MTVYIHGPSRCAGETCAIHNPSDHHMARMPWTLKISGIIERHCPHGCGHPDPDSLKWFRSQGYEMTGIHGCCSERCCVPPDFEMD